MKQVLIDLMARIDLIADFNHIAIWNNQLDDEEQAYSLPACFIEIENNADTIQLGGGAQLYEVNVNFHIIHENYNNAYQDTSQDLLIYDLKQKVYESIQGFEPTGCVAFVKINEIQDDNHSNLVHYQMIFETNIVDFTKEKYNKLLTDEATTLIINGTFN
jgi:hypothetical protein